MPQSGRELKARLAQLMRRHNVRPIARDPIPLLPPTAGSQIIKAIAASADVDADRMSFARGSLSWPDDLSKLPLLVRHSATGWLEKYFLSTTTIAAIFISRRWSKIPKHVEWAESRSPQP